MSKPEIRDILKAARDKYASSPSHAPRGSHPREGSVCAAMALDRSSNGWYCMEAEELVARAAGLVTQDPRMAIIDWNAKASTEEVLAAFDRAAELAV